MTTLDRIIDGFARLPGLGRKTAARIAYFILHADNRYVESLATDLLKLKEVIRPCRRCFTYTESDLCDVCSDSRRDTTTICVVEESQDVDTLERTGEFRGLYHVLGGTIAPMDGVGPDDLTIGALLARVAAEPIDEVIVATNPTVEGETTGLYVIHQLEPQKIRISQLALGLPVGSDLEYADRLTIARALEGRTVRPRDAEPRREAF